MKRILSLFLALLLLSTALVSCGKDPLDTPEKYVSVPDFSTIKIKNSDVQESYQEVMQDLLEDMTGEHFQKMSDRNTLVQKGDKVHVSYKGTPQDTSVILSDTALSAVNALESDRVFIIPGAGEVSSAIENILIGSKIGSELSVSVTYSEEDTDITDLVGKEINFVITVHSISRLTVSARHSVKLKFTAKLANGSAPLDTIIKLLEGGVETVDLADSEDTFDEVFSVNEISPLLVGKHKYDSLSFQLTLPAEKAKAYGYEEDVTISFEATITEATETPTLLTDELVESITEGQFTKVSEYENYCLNQIKEQMALSAVAGAATYNDDYPKSLYNKYYTDNYNEALYEYAGISTDYTTEQIENLLSEEVLAAIQTKVHESTISEIRERMLFEYCFNYFDLTLTQDEYNAELQELYSLYQIEYYYALLMYGIENISDFEALLGKEYLEVQFLYQKLPPLLKDAVQFVNE